MSYLGHYIRLHLTGSAAGIELFGRGEDNGDPHAREVLTRIRGELVEERTQLLSIADRVGARPAPLLSLVARVGEKVGRLKPNGHLTQRTALTDLVDLEAMLVAVSGKVGGWEVLIEASQHVEELPTGELQGLLAQAKRQHDELTDLHAEAGRRALSASH